MLATSYKRIDTGLTIKDKHGEVCKMLLRGVSWSNVENYTIEKVLDFEILSESGVSTFSLGQRSKNIIGEIYMSVGDKTSEQLNSSRGADVLYRSDNESIQVYACEEAFPPVQIKNREEHKIAHTIDSILSVRGPGVNFSLDCTDIYHTNNSGRKRAEFHMEGLRTAVTHIFATNGSECNIMGPISVRTPNIQGLYEHTDIDPTFPAVYTTPPGFILTLHPLRKDNPSYKAATQPQITL